jgi:spore germination protein KB
VRLATRRTRQDRALWAAAKTKGGAATRKDSRDEIYYTQVVILTAETVFATGFLGVARQLVPVAGTAAWISCFLGAAVGLLVAWLAGLLAQRFPDQNLVRMAEGIFTAPVGKGIGITFTAYCTFILAIGSRQFVLAIWIPFLQNTSPVLISAVFFLLIVYAAYLGIESIARVSLLFFTVVASSLVLLIWLAVPVSVPARLLPLGGLGTVPVLKASLLASSYAGECIVALAFIRHLKDKRGAARAIGTGAVIGMAVMALATGIGVMMLGTRGISRATFPALETARMVGVGEFLERAEILFLALWFSVALLKLAAVFYASVTSAADVLNLRDYRPLIIPYAILATVLSQIPRTDVETFASVRWFLTYTPWYAAALPALLLLGAMARGLRGGGDRSGTDRREAR